MDKETYVKRMAELNHIREKALQFNDKEREKAVESYNAANYPFKVGEKVIFTLNRSGIIEKIYANDYGDFSYDIRTIKKDGEPSKIIIHTNHGTRYIRHKKRPGIITGALPFRYRNERKPKLAPYGDENTKDNKSIK